MRRQVKADRYSTDCASTIASDDGALAFAVGAADAGAYVERIEPLKGIGKLSHLMQFRDIESFERACEVDPLRHTYPLAFLRLRQAVEKILKGERAPH